MIRFPAFFRIFMVLAFVCTTQVGRSQTPSELMEKGDTADRKFQAAEALKSYLPAEKLQPQNVPLLLRIARQYRHLMSETPTVSEKVRLGNIALGYGKKSARLAPNDSEAQLSTAITYGKMLPFLGKKEQVEASPRIKASADRAIQLDSTNDNAWHVLGRWHQSLANVTGLKRTLGEMLYGELPVGSDAESVLCFNKAIKINPRRLRNYIEEGRTYAQMGDPTTARRLLQKGIAMPNVEYDDPEIKVRGQDALAKLP